MSIGKRIERLRGFMKEKGVEAMIVSKLVNLRYFSGFTGDDSLLLITAERELLLTDFRYVEQAAEETSFEIVRLASRARMSLSMRFRLFARFSPRGEGKISSASSSIRCVRLRMTRRSLACGKPLRSATALSLMCCSFCGQASRKGMSPCIWNRLCANMDQNALPSRRLSRRACAAVCRMELHQKSCLLPANLLQWTMVLFTKGIIPISRAPSSWAKRPKSTGNFTTRCLRRRSSA